MLLSDGCECVCVCLTLYFLIWQPKKLTSKIRTPKFSPNSVLAKDLAGVRVTTAPLISVSKKSLRSANKVQFEEQFHSVHKYVKNMVLKTTLI